MNSLLLRQLKKHLPEDLREDKRLSNLLEAVNQSYYNYEDQFKMSQRAMQISSDELFEANVKLRKDAEGQQKIIKSLNYIVKVLKLESTDSDNDVRETVDLAKFIENQSVEILKINKQREELLANLESKNEELENYAHIVSHDLKSPLRSIDTLVNWILDDNQDLITEDSKANFDLILNNLEKMDAMISGILNYSTIDKVELEKYNVDIEYLVTQIKESLLIPNHIKLIVNPNLPTIIGDKFRLQQLFQNLIQNAIKSIDKEQGKVEIGFKEKENLWEFFIKDNGKGIDGRYHEKIFKIFQRIDDDQNATGIGLSIVKRIIDFYGGEIWLTSEISKGTTFYFTIPKNIK